jgi:hypothetical protein
MHSRYVALRMTGNVQDGRETRVWLVPRLSVVMVVPESNFRRGMWRVKPRFGHRAAWDDCSQLQNEETSETNADTGDRENMDMKHDEPKAGARTVVFMFELLMTLEDRYRCHVPHGVHPLTARALRRV